MKYNIDICKKSIDSKEISMDVNMIENAIDFFIENTNSLTLPIDRIHSSTLVLEKENSDLKRLNEILEKEINLLKSLLLINNLNLKTADQNQRK